MQKRYTLLFISVYYTFYGLCQTTPDPPYITKVRIDPITQMIHIYWDPSPTPGVTHYEISKWEYTGDNPFPSGNPIGTTTDLHFSYSDPDAQEHPLGYLVKAYIDDVDSENSNIDSTVHLSAVYDSCAASVYLAWNDYNSWRGQIQRYEIWGYLGNDDYQNFLSVPEGVNDTAISGILANNTYHFYIIARKISTDPDDYITSNRIDFDTPHSFYPEYIYANYGTVNEANNPDILFTIDPRSELTTYTLWRSDTPGNFSDSITQFITNDYIISFTDNVNAGEQPYYYQLKAINYCNQVSTISENIAGTIYLTSELNGYTANLNWTEYQNWPGGVENYLVERRFYGGEFELLSSSDNNQITDNSLEDMISSGNYGEVCYRITAMEENGNSFTSTPGKSVSNITCVSLELGIRFEYNAFIPESSDNNTFGPEMDFIPKQFHFKIFNRWGNLVFNTKDPFNSRWDGRNNNNLVPEGVYRYQLEFENETGKMTVIHGNVTVVRQ